MKTLKPCTCGSKRIAVMEDNYFLFCRDCGYSTNVYDTLHDAIEAWNERVEDNEGKTERKRNIANEST